MGRPPSSTDLSLTRITDVHIHVQPWRELKPNVLDMMWRGQNAHRGLMIQVMDDPRALLEVMDRSGVWRAGPVDHPSPTGWGSPKRANRSPPKIRRPIPHGPGRTAGGTPPFPR